MDDDWGYPYFQTQPFSENDDASLLQGRNLLIPLLELRLRVLVGKNGSFMMFHGKTGLKNTVWENGWKNGKILGTWMKMKVFTSEHHL